jgi:hypothetical protein
MADLSGIPDIRSLPENEAQANPLTGETVPHGEQRLLPIIRTDAGGFFGLGEHDGPKLDNFEGRFAQLLPPQSPGAKVGQLGCVIDAVVEHPAPAGLFSGRVKRSVGSVKVLLEQGAKSASADRGADKNLGLVLAVKMTCPRLGEIAAFGP